MTRIGNCSCFDDNGIYPPSDVLLTSGGATLIQFPLSIIGGFTLVQNFEQRTRYFPEIGTRIWEVTGTQIVLGAELFTYPAWFELRGRVNLNLSLLIEGDEQIIRTVSIAIKDESTAETEEVMNVSTVARGYVYDESYGGYPLEFINGVWQEDRLRVQYPFPPSTLAPPHNQSSHIRKLDTWNHRFQVTTTVTNGWHVIGSKFEQPPAVPGEDPNGEDNEFPSYFSVLKLTLC